MSARTSYPHHLVGAPADPPVRPDELDLIEAWRDYEAANVAAVLEERPELLGAASTNWRMAYSLDVLLAEANAAAPGRDKASDGGIGNAAHQAEGKASDHNPWVVLAGVGICRARDFDASGLDVAAAFERLRARAHAGQCPQVMGGGYAIYSGRITLEDWSGWAHYGGPNPHVTHGHVSVGRQAVAFDDRRPWGIWSPTAAPSSPPATTRPPAAPRGKWTGPDLRGSGLLLRADAPPGGQINGPRTAALQDWWRRRYPLYAKALSVDGFWGDQTSAVCYQFAHRSGIRSADGRNIGPQVARQLYLAGFRG